MSRVRPFRSYDVTLEDGSKRRQTSRHIRVSNKPPIVIHEDDSFDPLPPSSTKPMTAVARPSTALTVDGTNSKQTRVTPRPRYTEAVVTRSGRPVVLVIEVCIYRIIDAIYTDLHVLV